MSIEAAFRVKHPGFTLDVRLSLPGRGITALFGPSGSGKTTLLRCIAGLLRAEEGHLCVNSITWQRGRYFLPVHERPIGMVFQEASLFPHLSVQGNLVYGQKRVPAALQRVEMAQAVDLLGIGHLLERMPDSLSGGERQRVSIARALLTSPKLLLMDEPLASLDQQRKSEILPYLERLHDALDIPILYVSHAPEEVARLADHLVILRQGSVLSSGPLAETLSRCDLPIRLGDEAGVVINGTVEAIDTEYHLVRIGFGDGSLWVRHEGASPGQRQRLSILARDVSLALSEPNDASFLNILPAVVCELADDTHPAIVLVRLSVGQHFFLARLTRRSADTLAIRPGQPVWMQIKAVASVF